MERKMRGTIIALTLLFAVSLCGSAQVPKSKSVLTPAGWRLPGPADMKGQWTEKHWIDECRKFEEADKKAAKDAVEEIGRAFPKDATKATANVIEPCWKPDSFPVHSTVGDYNGDGIQDEARILISVGVPKPKGFEIRKSGMAGFFVFLNNKTGP